MEEVDINTLVSKNNYLIENIPDSIIIVGKIKYVIINYKYNQLDLSKVICDSLHYHDQEGESIKNHILPNSLGKLQCNFNNLTSLPKLPNSLERLDCYFNKLTSLPSLPSSIRILYCYNNELTSLPDLPSSIKGLHCYNNELTSLPDLPNSLEYLDCRNNQLISLPDFTHIDHDITLRFYQHQPLSITYIPYNPYLKIDKFYYDNKINIEDYPHNPITNQQELDKYMDYIKNYQLNRIKSARK